MLSVDGSFYTWLAAQPAFVELAVGVAFVVIIAPTVLAAAATAITRLEDFLVLHAQLPAFSPANLHPTGGSPRTTYLKPADTQRWTT